LVTNPVTDVVTNKHKQPKTAPHQQLGLRTLLQTQTTKNNTSSAVTQVS